MKKYANSTLQKMTKQELIEYIRMCEHNQGAAESFCEQQAKNMENFFKGWQPVVHAHWILKSVNGDLSTNKKCSACKKSTVIKEMVEYKYCPHCGAKMEQ